MPIEPFVLADFSGGEISAVSSTEPSESQWLLLEGLVLDQNGRLRAQWAGVTWGTEDDGS